MFLWLSKKKALTFRSKAIVSVIALVLVIVTVITVINTGHDLSGFYVTGSFFPVTSINFSKDGTFTAHSDIETLHGKYSKSGNTYSLDLPVERAKAVAL